MSWKEYSLDQLGYVSRGKSRHRPRDAEHLYGGQYPFIQTGDVKHSNLYITKYSQTYSEAGLAQSKLWPAGTLCITIAANIADTAILAFDACFPDSIIGFIPDDKKADARFIKYLFDAMLQKKYKNFTQGAAQDNLSQAKLLSIKIPVPSIQEQKGIADVLSTYDDLIENNDRRIALLEESARLLFKEWFVYFRFPGHEHVKIIDGVPEGWEKISLGEITKLEYGKSLKADDRIPGTYPVYGSSGIVGTHEKALVKGPGIIVGRKGNVGSVYWSDTDFYPIDTVYYICSEDSSYYLYYALLNTQFINTDVAVPGLNRDFAHSRVIMLPSSNILSHFNDFIGPIREKISNLLKQNEFLSQTRDLLLPRLMKGEIQL
ncbi:restriction endonuclease subunit S [Brevibacillus borstelensis]|uniref:restriction endonuclease subunit S n=1 Tax=Brevibacillus borstelensis TaxID=45462 RepID=UPI0004694D8B|nr:restriction endonuclease subunit S [Brevibacillus borstelensis]MCC0567236.1 restriction endonuclease subunit S [Brevibacillus borstelensis]MCM3561670.1 restriction endonuclease subunit S [Brevibacillus borstelensis]